MEQLRPNTFVEDAKLTQQIFTLRKVLGTDENGHQYIETFSKLGYRFAATVSKIPDETSNLSEKYEAKTSHIVTNRMD